MPEWTDEQKANQFKLEVRQHFEAKNAERRLEDAEDLARGGIDLADFAAKHPDYPTPDEKDARWMGIYDDLIITYKSNVIGVALPCDLAITSDFIELFEGTSVAWSRPFIDATIIDGEAHVVVEVVLVDTWDDERAVAWCKEHESGGHVMLLPANFDPKSVVKMSWGGTADDVSDVHPIEEAHQAKKQES